VDGPEQDYADKTDNKYVDESLHSLVVSLRARLENGLSTSARGAPKIVDAFAEQWPQKRSEGRVGNPRLPVTCGEAS
jgi:hypothetical protein